MLKRLLMFMTLTASLLVMAPVQEAAADGGWWNKWREWRQERMQQRRSRSQRVKRFKSWSYRQTKPSRSVPELDPGTAGTAIVLLVGGVAYIASRRREEDIA